MGQISNIELASSTSYFTALFVTEGVVYDVVFTRHNECNLGWESNEVINVQRGCEDVVDDALWREIEEHVCSLPERQDTEIIRFSVEISREYLETLEQLVKLVLASSQSSPEGALEAAIFSQIQQQLRMR